MSMIRHLVVTSAADRECLVLCGQREFAGVITDKPHTVTCPACVDRMAQWRGQGTRLPSWTSYQVDEQTHADRARVLVGHVTVEVKPGAWLLRSKDGVIGSVMPGTLEEAAAS